MLYGGDILSLKSKLKNNKTFDNLFGFESGVDITDETKVLYRRNNVIKRIIFLSNLVFSGLFALLSFGESSNILLTIILFFSSMVFWQSVSSCINLITPSDTLFCGTDKRFEITFVLWNFSL